MIRAVPVGRELVDIFRWLKLDSGVVNSQEPLLPAPKGRPSIARGDNSWNPLRGKRPLFVAPQGRPSSVLKRTTVAHPGPGIDQRKTPSISTTPESILSHKRLFSEKDVIRLARRLKAEPDWSAAGRDALVGDEQPTEGLTLRPPHEVKQVGESGHEVRDGDGEVFAWTSDRSRA